MPSIRHPPRQAAVICLLLALQCGASARAEAPALPETHQTYRIDATLDPEAHTVTGTVELAFTNTTSVPLETLWLHLYQNAFRDRDSVFMRDSRGQLRRDEARGDGQIQVTELEVLGEDRLVVAEFEVVKGDRTQLRVPLAAPLAPGAEATLQASFRTDLPPTFARSGHEGEFHAITQWFPKLAKLDPRRGQRSFPYHALGEFFSDFARYELTLRTPRGFVVGASGQLLDRHDEGKQTHWRFEADAVHDAAWVASPHLRERTVKHGATRIRMLYPPGYERAVDAHLATTRAGLTHFGKRFGPYPYPNLTVVVPPRGASGAAGMEYPTLFLTAGFWTEFPGLPTGSYVTAHELAHQWFQGLLASDEVRWPFLDEGLAEWATHDLMRTMHGARWAAPLGLTIAPFEITRFFSARAAVPPPGQPAFGYVPRQYGASVYQRTALVLETLRRTHGAHRFDRAMARYAREQRFRHPEPDDLFAAFDAEYSPGFAARFLRPALLEGAAVDLRLVEARSREQDDRFRTEIRARRETRLPLPTWVGLYDRAGRSLARVPWPAGEDTLHLSVDTAREVGRVELDPDRALLLDANARDQTKALVRVRPVGSLSARWLGWLQALMSWVGA